MMGYLFTIIAFFGVVAIAMFTDRQQRFDSDKLDTNAKQVRQELRLIAFLLAAILIMLGIIADRIR
jgi:hypothetical protein